MLEQEKNFEKLVPMKSCLGREFLAMQAERDKQRQAFEKEKDKMGADTLAYRRAENALDHFLEETIPLVMAANMKLTEGTKERLEVAEQNAKNPRIGYPIKIDRRSEQIIWTRHAIERFRIALPKKDRKKLKSYHPELWNDLGIAWGEFRKQIKTWQFGGQPFDGSQAMHSMIAFQVKARLMGSAND